MALSIVMATGGRCTTKMHPYVHLISFRHDKMSANTTDMRLNRSQNPFRVHFLTKLFVGRGLFCVGERWKYDYLVVKKSYFLD